MYVLSRCSSEVVDTPSCCGCRGASPVHTSLHSGGTGGSHSRSSAGKYPMDVGEVRRAFVLSEGVADRIRAFRAERLSRVVAGETPVAIEGTSRVVLHVVPISAFDSPASVVDLDIYRPPLSERVLLPIYIVNEVGLDETLLRYPDAFELRYNFDGVFCDAQLGLPGRGRA